MLPCLPVARAKCSWHATPAWITSVPKDQAIGMGRNGQESRKYRIGMVETTKNPGEKTLSVAPTKTLTLKPRGVEQGVVRQAFSHGRSKAVVVEKVKRRVGGAPPAKAEAPPGTDGAPAKRAGAGKAAPAGAVAAPVTAPAQAPAPAPPKSGVVLRTLTEDEQKARVHAL